MVVDDCFGTVSCGGVEVSSVDWFESVVWFGESDCLSSFLGCNDWSTALFTPWSIWLLMIPPIPNCAFANKLNIQTMDKVRITKMVEDHIFLFYNLYYILI